MENIEREIMSMYQQLKEYKAFYIDMYNLMGTETMETIETESDERYLYRKFLPLTPSIRSVSIELDLPPESLKTFDPKNIHIYVRKLDAEHSSYPCISVAELGIHFRRVLEDQLEIAWYDGELSGELLDEIGPNLTMVVEHRTVQNKIYLDMREISCANLYNMKIVYKETVTNGGTVSEDTTDTTASKFQCLAVSEDRVLMHLIKDYLETYDALDFNFASFTLNLYNFLSFIQSDNRIERALCQTLCELNAIQVGIKSGQLETDRLIHISENMRNFILEWYELYLEKDPNATYDASLVVRLQEFMEETAAPLVAIAISKKIFEHDEIRIDASSKTVKSKHKEFLKSFVH